MIDSIRSWLSHSILLRISFIGFIVLILQIPLAMINSQIYERDVTRANAIRDIEQKWGQQQSIYGPRLVVPYTEMFSWKDNNGKLQTSQRRRYAVLLAEDLNISAKVSNETRYRGIFEVPVYQTTINMSGEFARPQLKHSNIDLQLIDWKHAELLVGVSDARAIQKQVVLRWENSNLTFEPGLGESNTKDNGFHVPQLPLTDKNESYKFNIAMTLNGSGALHFAPMAKNTHIEIQSDWPDPSFQGYKLPNQRQVSDTGFSAQWTISHISRNYPQQWLDHEFDYSKFDLSMIGVDFISPIDNYRMTERSIKYDILFLLLTFVAIWLLEIFYKLRVHLMQYLLLGLGMCLFYLLLLAFSEHISFIWSYVIASSAVVAMTTLYCKAILQTSSRAMLIGGGITVLYLYLYSLLQEQNYSLLFGSIGVFVTLGVIMYVTRNVDWYNLAKRGE